MLHEIRKEADENIKSAKERRAERLNQLNANDINAEVDEDAGA